MKSTLQTKQNPKSKSTQEKYESFWTYLFKTFLFVSAIGIFFLFRDVNKFRNKLTSLNPNYKLPTIKDLKPCLYLIPLIIFIRIISKKLLISFCEKIMKKSYRFPKTNKDKQLFEKYRLKLPEHLTKLFAYLFMTLFGYFTLKDLDYFPKSLLGKGWMPEMFSKGYPNCFYLTKPKNFDFYYMLCLSYFSSDSLWLFILNDKQSDFIIMLLHHVCTIPLILFSFFTNFSNVGSIVLILHTETDIFVHLTRFLIQTDVYEIFKNISGILLTIDFLYMRIYVLGDMIYTLYFYMTWKWDSVTLFLFTFLIVLYFIHINWTTLLLQKFYGLLKGKKLTDTRSYDVKEENNPKLKNN